MKELEKVNSHPLLKSYISEENGIKFINNSMKNQGIKLGILETAKNMLNNNFSIDTILKCTGLSVNQINNKAL